MISGSSRRLPQDSAFASLEPLDASVTFKARYPYRESWHGSGCGTDSLSPYGSAQSYAIVSLSSTKGAAPAESPSNFVPHQWWWLAEVRRSADRSALKASGRASQSVIRMVQDRTAFLPQAPRDAAWQIAVTLRWLGYRRRYGFSQSEDARVLRRNFRLAVCTAPLSAHSCSSSPGLGGAVPHIRPRACSFSAALLPSNFPSRPLLARAGRFESPAC